MALRFSIFVIAALATAACTGVDRESDTSTLTVSAYADRMIELMEAPVPEEDFPIGGSNVRIAGIFAVVEEGLAGMRALQPPPELQDIHSALLVRFDAVQEAVASYLQHHGVVGERIEMDHLVADPEIGPLIESAREGCREWESKLRELGESVSIGVCLV